MQCRAAKNFIVLLIIIGSFTSKIIDCLLMFMLVFFQGLELLNQLLLYDPTVRISARDALRHSYFRVKPYPKETDLMPTFPSLHGG